MNPDDRPDIIAGVDQSIEQHKQLARMVAAYNSSLRGLGLPPHLANTLTVEYQTQLFENGRHESESDD
jgi:hypothetical protein